MTIYEIQVNNVPSQRFNVQIGDAFLDIRLKALQNVKGLFIDIRINDEDIILGMWCKQDVNLLQPILPYYPDMAVKALFFKSKNDVNDIDYSDLGNATRLYYAI